MAEGMFAMWPKQMRYANVPSFLTVKLSLNKYYDMKAYGAVDVEIRTFLTSAVVGGEWSVSRPGRFTPGIHWIGG
jgi:hypothetical protein